MSDATVPSPQATLPEPGKADSVNAAAPEKAPARNVDTGGGAYIEGYVNVQNGDFVGRDKITNVILPPGTQRAGSAPPLPQLVIGREEALRDLKTRLGIAPGGQVPAALQALTTVRGWPGVGKTTMAAALAHDPDVMTAFPDGVLWASLGPQPDLFSQLAAWGRDLNTDDIGKARTLEEAAAQLTALLRAKKMLLIVDDVWEPEHALPFKVGGRACAILITTRIHSVAQALAPTADDIYWLPVLTDEKALELLQNLAPKVVAQNPKAALELARELVGLPLALQVAGRLLYTEASHGFGVSDLLAELRTGAKLLESEAPADITNLAQQTTPTVVALLQKSAQRLDEQTRQCFARLGVFATNPASLDLAAMQAVWQVGDPKPVARALMDRGLLEYMPERNCYQMHALLHQYGQTLLTAEEATEARRNHFTFFQGLAKNYAGVDLSEQGISKTQEFELFYPQMKQALVNFEKVYELSALKTVPGQLRQMIQLIDTLDQYWTLHTQFANQVEWLEVAYNCAAALNDTLTQAGFARRMGRVLSLQGHLEDALAWMERCKTALGEDESKEANTIRATMHIHTASIQYQQGNLEAAEKDCERGISLGNHLHNDKVHIRIRAEGYNLLGVIQSGNGKLAGALKSFKKSVSLWGQVGDRYQIARVTGNISSMHYYQGHFPQARDAMEKSLAYWEQFPDRTELAMALTNLGAVYDCLGREDLALDLQIRAMQISDLIEFPRIQALIRNHIADIYIKLEKYVEAETCLNESLQIQTEHGIEEYRVATQCYLAELACGRKLYQQAIELAEAALDLAQKDGDPLEEGDALRALGHAYSLYGKLEQARECLETSLSRLRENEYKYESYLTLQMLATLYTDLNDAQKAQAAANDTRKLAKEMGLNAPTAASGQ